MAGRMQAKRHIVQVLAALLFNLDFDGFSNGTVNQGAAKGVCVPGLNCYSCPGAIGSCPVGALQNALIALDKGMLFYVVGTILAFGALLGRTVCGWLCPIGLLQDLLDKAPFPKVRKGTWSRVLSWAKYAVLAVLVIIMPLWLLAATGIGAPAFCEYLCPAGTLEAGIPLVAVDSELQMSIGFLFDWKVAVLAALVVLSLFVYRPFCRFLCPLGALYSFFNRIAVVRYRVDESRCEHCGTCVAECKMDVSCVGDRECIQCGACAAGCPAQAIAFSLAGLRKDAPMEGESR